MSIHPTHNTPPVIRVFLSSTFADMERERSYFNEVMVPKISRICAERGVSFFSVDLRWGITQEDQVNGQVLPICLGEIDKCRPYFIGIVGNRYGSVLETVPPRIARDIPWLEGREGHSITELEMLYAVLDKESNSDSADSAFYMRSDRLSQELYGDLAPETDAARQRLAELKRRIAEDPAIPSAAYDSMEEFGDLVMRDLLHWLDTHFPASADVDRIRREWYNGELLRHYIAPSKTERFLDAYLAESKKPLLFHGDGARGKTAFLTAWHPRQGRKIVINCAADDRFSYWPSVARYLVRCMQEIQPDCGAPEESNGASALLRLMDAMANKKPAADQADHFFVTDEERDRFRQSFLTWFGGLKVSQPVTVIINDLQLLEDEQSRLLSWLPAVLPEDVRLVCSTNDDEMVLNAEMLGWNVKEMPLFEPEHAATLVTDYLHTYGKKLTDSQMARLLRSVCAQYPGQLRFVAAFLVNFGRFNILDELIDAIAACREIEEIYRYAYDYLMREYTPRESAAVRLVMGLVRCSPFSLGERDCYAMCQAACDVTAIEWARCCRLFEQFDVVQGDYWNMRNEKMCKFVDRLLTDAERQTAHLILGDRSLRLLQEESADGGVAGIRAHTAYAKAVLFHYRNAAAWDKLLSAVTEHLVLKRLLRLDWQYVRVAWMALFLHTDCDIPACLLALIRRYVGGDEESRAIAWRIGGLFIDLSYYARADEACAALGVDHVKGSLNADLERMVTDRFIPVYNKMNELKNAGNMRHVLAFIEEIRSGPNDYNAVETCQIWFFKAGCEIRIQLYEAAMQSVNTYYEIAIQAGLPYEMMRALTMRGDVMFRQHRNRETMDVQYRLQQMALNSGDLRSYLSAQNVLGMCMYRLERFDEALAIFDSLLVQWDKLGERREVGSTYLNKCNALHYSGHTRAALELGEAFVAQAEGDPELCGVCTQLLGNLGGYASELKKFDKAESYLTEALARAKADNQEGTVIYTCNALVSMYQASDRVMKAVEVREEQLELLWSRREYGAVMQMLDETITWLFQFNCGARARRLENRWRERFSAMEGGAAFFEARRRTDTVDTVQVDRIKEQIIMAKGEGDRDKQALLLVRLTDLLKISAVDEAVAYLLEAAYLYRDMGDTERHRMAVEHALMLLFDEGETQYPDLCEQVLQCADDAVVRDVVRVWRLLAGKHTKEDPTVYPMLCALMEHAAAYESLVARCFFDLADAIVHTCTAQELIAVVERFSDAHREDVRDSWARAMFSGEDKVNSELKVDYLSPAATEKLDFYEKAVAFMHHYDLINAAALAGNIAIIFRRRKDREKAFYYHKLSAERYRKAEQMHDALIEMMNLATAYREFGDMAGAINLLREALALAAEVGDTTMEATVAGNLASCLTQQGAVEDTEELLRCFALEEAYFRNSANDRDLVISLLNQAIYLHDKADVSVWYGKVEEAGALVSKNRFEEFRSVLNNLQWYASRQKASAPQAGGEDFRGRVAALLAAVGGYAIDTVDCTDGVYRAICSPTEQKLPGDERLFLFHRPETAGTLVAVAVFHPPMAPQDLETLNAYTQWWNGLKEYALAYDTNEQWLRADVHLLASDWDAMATRLARFVQLWEADKINLLSLILGIVDLDLCQGTKLQVLNGDEE